MKFQGRPRPPAFPIVNARGYVERKKEVCGTGVRLRKSLLYVVIGCKHSMRAEMRSAAIFFVLIVCCVHSFLHRLLKKLLL